MDMEGPTMEMIRQLIEWAALGIELLAVMHEGRLG